MKSGEVNRPRSYQEQATMKAKARRRTGRDYEVERKRQQTRLSPSLTL